MKVTVRIEEGTLSPVETEISREYIVELDEPIALNDGSAVVSAMENPPLEQVVISVAKAAVAAHRIQ